MKIPGVAAVTYSLIPVRYYESFVREVSHFDVMATYHLCASHPYRSFGPTQVSLVGENLPASEARQKIRELESRHGS